MFATVHSMRFADQSIRLKLQLQRGSRQLDILVSAAGGVHRVPHPAYVFVLCEVWLLLTQRNSLFANKASWLDEVLTG
ncbi:MAG: hypothetical protein WA125_10580 [Desulfosporosinus sp.]